MDQLPTPGRNVNFKINEGLLEQVEAMAQQTGTDVLTIIQAAITTYIENRRTDPELPAKVAAARKQ